MRQLEDKFEEAMTLKADYLNRFKMLYSISKKLCRFCFDVSNIYLRTNKRFLKRLE